DPRDMELALETPARLRALPQASAAPPPGDATDSALLIRVAGRDREAFELLYQRYVRSMFGLALRRLRDRQRAEDAVQETFAAVWRSAASYRPERGPAAPWLYAIARNTVVDRFRTQMDVTGDERARLEQMHELLVAAGAPPELSPRLESGPTLAMTLSKPHKPVGRRIALLAATVAILAAAFVFGYLAGNRGGGLASAQTLTLTGTRAAPSALASLQILPSDTSGNWPMK